MKDVSPYYKGDRQLPQLQVLKALCALMVIEIHVPSVLHTYVAWLIRVAVPIFYMITGYFLLNSCGRLEADRVKRTAVKLLRIYVAAQLLYFTLNIAFRIFDGKWYQLLDSCSKWMEMLLGGWWADHLWYLAAGAQALAIIWLLTRLRRLSWLPCIAATTLIAGIYINFFCFHSTEINLLLSRNFLTVSLPCLTLGMLIRRYEAYVQAVAASRWALIGLLTTILTYAEYTVCIKLIGARSVVIDIWCMTIPMAVVVFITSLRSNYNTWLSPLEIIGRRHSLNLYIIHIFYYWILLSPGLLTTIGYPRPHLTEAVILLTLLTSILIQWVKVKRRQKIISIQ